MTLQRQFILPNCQLNLEGISNSISDAALGSSLDVLLRLECQFGNLTQPLSGGLELLNSLIAATNQCTQSWMSGVPHRQLQRNADPSVLRLLPKEEEGFELTIPAELLNEPPKGAETTIRVDLTTLQLFDLVEALDQLLADQQTLPNLSLAVQPLSRSEAASGQGLQKSTPAVLGAASVAIAASAFYLLPVPTASKPPKDPPKAEPTNTETPTPGTAPPGVSPFLPQPPSPGESPSPENSEASPSPDASPKPEASP